MREKTWQTTVIGNESGRKSRNVPAHRVRRPRRAVKAVHGVPTAPQALQGLRAHPAVLAMRAEAGVLLEPGILAAALSVREIHRGRGSLVLAATARVTRDRRIVPHPAAREQEAGRRVRGATNPPLVTA
jgi:hypothetical protein